MSVIVPIKVRYAETDRMGIAHHSKYPVWFEEARTIHSEAIGAAYSDVEANGFVSPLLECNCRYMGTCTYADELEIETRLVVCTPIRYEYHYWVRKKGEEKPIAEGVTKHAWVKKDTFKVSRIDRGLPEFYRIFSQNCEPLPEEDKKK